MIQIHPVKLESYLFSEKQWWPAEGGFPKPIALCIPRLCLWFHLKYCTRGYQRRNNGGTKIDIFILFIFFPYQDTQHLLLYTKAAAGSCSLVRLFFQVNLAETRTGCFSKESRCVRNKFITLPLGLRFQQNILNTLTSQRKTHFTTLFIPEQLPVDAFDRNSHLSSSWRKCVLKNSFSESFQVEFAVKIFEKYLWRSSFTVTLHAISLQLY